MNKRVNFFGALSPTTKVSHSPSSLLHSYIQYQKFAEWFYSTFKVYEIFGIYWNEIFKLTCGLFNGSFCLKEEGQIINLKHDLDDSDRFQVYMGHLPGGTSIKVIDHFV